MNFDDVMHYEDARTPDEKCDVLRASILELTQALMYMNQIIGEVNDHTNEHHTVINELGRTTTLLEELLIGGSDDEAPTA